MAKEKKNKEEASHIVLDRMDLNKKLMLDALKKNLGIVSKSCEEVGISRQTHHNWLKDDKEYHDEVKALYERSVDYAEGQLFNLMAGAKKQVVTNAGAIVEIKDAPNATAIIFYLKTKGKHRGYVERIENEISLAPTISDIAFMIKRRDDS